MKSREEFIEFISQSLPSDFQKDPEKELWTRKINQRLPGQTVIINGVRKDQPGKIVTFDECIEVVGDGEIEDVGSGDIKKFIQVDFYMISGEDHINYFPEMCFYFDDEELFSQCLDVMNKTHA